MYILHCMLRSIGQAEFAAQQSSLGGQIEGMRRRGMSATAIRRALGLNAREAAAAGILSPLAPLAPGPSGAAPKASPGTVTPAPAALSRGGPAMLCVLEAVAQASGLSAAHLLGPGQARALVRPRQLTMYLLRQHCAGASLPAIGHFMKRDHTTVLYGCRRAAALLARDSGFRSLYDRALRRLAETSHAPG